MPDKLISDLELDGIYLDTTEQLFVDTGRILRYHRGTYAVNQTTGAVTQGAPTVIYTGECSVFTISSRRDRFDERGGALIFSRQYRIILPPSVQATDIQLGDTWVTDTSDDPGLIGREMEIKDVLPSSIAGYRRITALDAKQ